MASGARETHFATGQPAPHFSSLRFLCSRLLKASTATQNALTPDRAGVGALCGLLIRDDPAPEETLAYERFLEEYRAHGSQQR